MGDYDDDERPNWRELDAEGTGALFTEGREGGGKEEGGPKDRGAGRVKDAWTGSSRATRERRNTTTLCEAP
jgi:hypothetical protein